MFTQATRTRSERTTGTSRSVYVLARLSSPPDADKVRFPSQMDPIPPARKIAATPKVCGPCSSWVGPQTQLTHPALRHVRQKQDAPVRRDPIPSRADSEWLSDVSALVARDRRLIAPADLSSLLSQVGSRAGSRAKVR